MKNIWYILSVILLLINVIVLGYYLENKLITKEKVNVIKQEKKENIPKVITKIFESKTNKLSFNAIASVDLHKYTIKSELNEKITYLNDKIVVGKELKKDEILLKVDCRKNEITKNKIIKQIENLERDLYKLKLEEDTAKKETELLNIPLNKDEKQIIHKVLEIENLENTISLKKLELDEVSLILEKCIIQMPFDGLILTKNNNITNNIFINTNLDLYTITNKNIIIKIPLTVNQFKLLDLQKSKIIINEKTFSISYYEKIANNSNSVNIYVETTLDKLNFLDKEKIEVEVIIEKYSNTIKIPNKYIHKNKIYIYKDGILKIKDIDIIEQMSDYILIKNPENMEIIINELSIVSNNMKVEK